MLKTALKKKYTMSCRIKMDILAASSMICGICEDLRRLVVFRMNDPGLLKSEL